MCSTFRQIGNDSATASRGWRRNLFLTGPLLYGGLAAPMPASRRRDIVLAKFSQRQHHGPSSSATLPRTSGFPCDEAFMWPDRIFQGVVNLMARLASDGSDAFCVNFLPQDSPLVKAWLMTPKVLYATTKRHVLSRTFRHTNSGPLVDTAVLGCRRLHYQSCTPLCPSGLAASSDVSICDSDRCDRPRRPTAPSRAVDFGNGPLTLRSSDSFRQPRP